MNSFWKTCVIAILRKFPRDTYEFVDADVDAVGDIYERGGGSWEKLAKGSPEEWEALRKVCKRVLKSRVEENEKQ